MYHIAIGIRKNLDFNVSWLFHISLNEHSVISERSQCFRFGSGISLIEFSVASGYSHTSTTTSSRCLDNDWEMVFVGEGSGIFKGLNWSIRAWDGADFVLDGECLGSNLDWENY